MPSYFFIIFIIGLAVIIGGHYFLYFSAVKFFPVFFQYRHILMIILLFLSVSFILFNFLASWDDNIFTRTGYYLTGIWMGLSLYLIIAAFLVWLIIFLAKIVDVKVNISTLALIFFALALVYTLWGAWNAKHPQINNITVNIPGLPDAWKGKKIVQISDVHIGLVNRSGFARRVVDLVNNENPDTVFITGDLYDHIDKDLTTTINLVNSLEAKEEIFYITGNHETYVGLERVYSDLSSSKAKILADEVVDINGLKIIGVSYPQRGEEKNIVETIKNLQGEFLGRPNILLYHSPVNIPEIKNLGVNLMLSGHTHAGQVWPLQYIHQSIYGKYYRGLHIMDNFTLYVTSGTGSWGPAIRTGSRPEIVVITLECN